MSAQSSYPRAGQARPGDTPGAAEPAGPGARQRRLALLVTAGLGIFRLLSRKEQATPQRIPHPPDGWPGSTIT